MSIASSNSCPASAIVLTQLCMHVGRVSTPSTGCADTGRADSGGKQAQHRSTTPQNVLVTAQPAVKLRPVISKDGTRQELHQTIKLYRVPASSLRAASQSAQSPRQHQCQHKKAKQEKHTGQQPKTQGQAQVGTVEQISTAEVSRQQVPTPGEKTSKREKQRIVRLGKS